MNDQQPEKPGIEAGGAPFDPTNPFLSIAPAALTVSVQNTPQGQRLLLTIRTVNATLGVMLATDEAANWAEVIQRERAKMTGLILPGNIPMNGHPND